MQKNWILLIIDHGMHYDTSVSASGGALVPFYPQGAPCLFNFFFFF
jgi:hypothetical protein